MNNKTNTQIFYPEEWGQMEIEDKELQKQLEKEFLADIAYSNSDYEQQLAEE